MRRLINQRPARGERLTLGLVPFLVLLLLYVFASQLRLAENANDKLLPSLGSMAETFHAYAFTEDARTGQYLFWSDTWASLKRIGSALLISAALGLVLALAIGVVPRIRALLMPLLSTVAMIPPLAVLPILFIILGLEETAKITLIVIGILPCMARDLSLRIAELPEEQLVKAQTLGASHLAAGAACRAAPDAAAAHRLAAAQHGFGMAVPHCRRSHRLDRRPGLSHLPGAALPGHGRDSSLCGLDHLAGGGNRHAAAAVACQGLCLGGARQLMARVSVQNVWKQFGSHVVLENLRLERGRQ